VFDCPTKECLIFYVLPLCIVVFCFFIQSFISNKISLLQSPLFWAWIIFCLKRLYFIQGTKREHLDALYRDCFCSLSKVLAISSSQLLKSLHWPFPKVYQSHTLVEITPGQFLVTFIFLFALFIVFPVGRFQIQVKSNHSYMGQERFAYLLFLQ
jgi:hypothetical protein